MKRQEQEAMKRIEELLHEYPDERYCPHVLREDLETLVKLIKNAQKSPVASDQLYDYRAKRI